MPAFNDVEHFRKNHAYYLEFVMFLCTLLFCAIVLIQLTLVCCFTNTHKKREKELNMPRKWQIGYFHFEILFLNIVYKETMFFLGQFFAVNFQIIFETIRMDGFFCSFLGKKPFKFVLLKYGYFVFKSYLLLTFTELFALNNIFYIHTY